MKTINLKTACMCLMAGLMLASCASSYDAVGTVGMLAPDRVDKGVKYSKLTTNSGGGKQDLKNSKASTVTQAVQQVIDNVPGGKYMTNVTVYVVNGGYVAVKGDVWGIGTDTVPNTAMQSDSYFTLKLLDRQKNISSSKALAVQ